MAAAKAFLDSNVILYLLSANTRKADKAESLLAANPTVSVQVLNEVASVATRKLQMDWQDVHTLLDAVRASCKVEALTLATHESALRLAQRYRIGFFDASIAAAALLSGCTSLFSEDLHAGLLIEGKLRVRNPFL